MSGKNTRQFIVPGETRIKRTSKRKKKNTHRMSREDSIETEGRGTGP